MQFVLIIILTIVGILKMMIRTEQVALSAVLIKKIVSFFGILIFIKMIIFLIMKTSVVTSVPACFVSICD